MALSILPHLMTTSAKKNHVTKDIVILTATSGDTGKLRWQEFADVPGTKIIVFYPKNGVSRVQEMQMVTQKGANTSVVAIHGNFDNAQSGVKRFLKTRRLQRNWMRQDISSLPQIRSTSVVWYLRLCIMSMRMQNCFRTTRFKVERRSM